MAEVPAFPRLPPFKGSCYRACGAECMLVEAYHAKAQRADAVAMATHSRTGLRRFVLGSVAAQVLRDLDVPVMLVHPYDPIAHVGKADAGERKKGF